MLVCAAQEYRYDLTIVGDIKWADGLARLPISLARLFKNELKINSIHNNASWDNVMADEQRIFRNPREAQVV